MNRDDYQKAKQIFHSALEIEATERGAFLAQACGDDKSLRQNVETLLNSFRSNFLEESAIKKMSEKLADRHVLINQNLGRYKILERVGEGGMGEVFLAEDDLLHRRVAIKVLPTHLATDSERVRRFRREARAVSALNYPNILTIHEIGEENGFHFIVSELVNGETLRSRLQHKKLTVNEALDIAAQIASALKAAHDAGIVHRDIKPENIMLRHDNLVKVLDFGLAKLIENKAQIATDGNTGAHFSSETSPGIVMGTTAYMSPEQARGQAVDARTDIWSLGVCLFEMLTARQPFAGETTGDLIAAILKTEITSPENFNPQIPEELRSIIVKALAKNSDERYQTADEILIDLRRLEKTLENNSELRITVEKTIQNQTSNTNNFPITDENQKLKTAGLIKEIETKSARRLPKPSFSILSIGLLLILGSGLALYYAASIKKEFVLLADSFRPSKEFTFSSMKLTKLTSSGSAFGAVVSPNGKYIAYEMRNAGKHSIWLMGIETNSNLQVIAPTDTSFSGITFSPTRDYIYYLSAESQQNQTLNLYQIPMFGGEAKKLITAIDSPISFSPDGQSFAFIRNNRADGTTNLMTANADGIEEKLIIQRKTPNNFSSGKRPAWSPDGATIACIGINAGSNFARIIAVDVANGAEKQLTTQDWFSLQDVAWLPDSKTLLLTAQDDRNFGPLQIWRLKDMSGDGTAEKITLELNNYIGLSLPKNAESLITTQSSAFNNIWIVPKGETERAKQILSNKGGGRVDMSWTRNGKIVYTSNASGNPNIYVMNSDGTNELQLTSDTFGKRSPVVSPDDRYVVFVSNQNGTEQLWRMDIDGTNQKQLTVSQTYLNPSFTPDGKSIIYLTWKDKSATINRISIDGGESIALKEKLPFTPAISPDMKLIAYHEKDSQTGQAKIKILSFEKDELLKSFDVPANAFPNLLWSPDSQSIVYRSPLNNTINFWQQPIKGSTAKQLTNFRYDPPVHCEFSRDGKNMSCVRTALIRDVVLFNNLQ